jgi:hypothetical protein
MKRKLSVGLAFSGGRPSTSGIHSGLLGTDSNYQIAIGINEQLMHLINVDELMMS